MINKMSSVMDMFDTLPLDTIKEVLYDLPVVDVVNTCKAYNLDKHICNNKDFWIEYIRLNTKMEQLMNERGIPIKKLFSYFNPGSLFWDETDEILRQLIPDANDYILTALYLERSTIVTYIARKGTGIPYRYTKEVISGYDMLHHRVDLVQRPGLSYAHWLGLENYTLLYDQIDGLILLTFNSDRYPITLLKPYDQATIDDVYIDGHVDPLWSTYIKQNNRKKLH
jgi:hypothetical protein